MFFLTYISEKSEIKQGGHCLSFYLLLLEHGTVYDSRNKVFQSIS